MRPDAKALRPTLNLSDIGSCKLACVSVEHKLADIQVVVDRDIRDGGEKKLRPPFLLPIVRRMYLGGRRRSNVRACPRQTSVAQRGILEQVGPECDVACTREHRKASVRVR